MAEPKQHNSPINFSVDDDGGLLRATFTPGHGNQADIAQFKQSVQLAGYAEWLLDDVAINQFLTACAHAVEPVSANVGERRDASYQLEVADDLLNAWLTMTPARGGRKIGVEVRDELRDRGICHGILEAALSQALERGDCHRVLIARGEPPVEGRPGWFDTLFDGATTHAVVDDNAKVRFRDLSHLIMVEPNDPLMRLHPPVQGTNGRDIKGQIVYPAPLPDIQFGTELQGTATDSADPQLLRAARGGQPVEVENGVIVNPVITVKNVDLTTGKIDFDGTLQVEGDIMADMSVQVTGDVIVQGMVESADINAGGNVAVAGGVLGRADKKAGSQNLAASAARIKCKGTLQALYMENVHAEAGDAIVIAQSARHCELIAKNNIVVGGPQSGSSGKNAGQIIGGRAQAGMLVQADVLGTNVATKTTIQVGVDPYLDEEIHKLESIIQRKVNELDQVLKLIVHFQKNPQKNVDGIAAKVEAKRVQQLAEIDELTAQLHQLQAKLELIAKASVRVGRTVHDGVEILIGKQQWKVREDSGGGMYIVTNGVIVMH